MKRISLQPHQIITSELFFASEPLLQVYYRIFKADCEKCLPPILVAEKNRLNVKIDPNGKKVDYRLGTAGIDKYHQLLEKTFSKGAGYFLLDGNHRAVAAALCNTSLDSFLIEDEKDIKKLRRLAQHGELFNLPPELMKPFTEMSEDYTSAMISLFQASFMHASGDPDQNSPKSFSLKDRVSYLARNNHLPIYIKHQFLRR